MLDKFRQQFAPGTALKILAWFGIILAYLDPIYRTAVCGVTPVVLP